MVIPSEARSSPRLSPWYLPCNPRGSPCPPPCAAGEDTPCVPRGTANADGKYPPPGTPRVAPVGHGLEPVRFDTSPDALEFPPARHRVHRGTTREGRGATPSRTSARCGMSRCQWRPSSGYPANTVSTRGRPGRGKVGSNPMTGNCRPSRLATVVSSFQMSGLVRALPPPPWTPGDDGGKWRFRAKNGTSGS